MGETGSSSTVSLSVVATLTPAQQEGNALSGAGSESPSFVDDEATTSRLELFQISALTGSCEDDLTPNLSVEEESISVG